MYRKNQTHRKNARRLSIIHRNEKALRKADKGKPPMALRDDDAKLQVWRSCLEEEIKILKEKLDGSTEVS